MGNHRRVAVAWQPDDGRFVAVGRNVDQRIAVNAPPPPEDRDRPAAGFSPIELLLASVGTCAGWDVIQMLRKRRAGLQSLDVSVEGDQADEPPWQYERIGVHFAVHCDGLTVGVLERVVRLACVRYCGALATVRGVASVEASMELTVGDGPSTGRLPVRLDLEPDDPITEAGAEPAADED